MLICARGYMMVDSGRKRVVATRGIVGCVDGRDDVSRCQGAVLWVDVRGKRAVYAVGFG